MFDINSLTFNCSNTHFAISLEHSFCIYQIKPLKMIFQKEFLNYKILQISISNDGNLIAILVLSLIEKENNQKIFIWNNYFSEAETQLVFSEEIMKIILRQNHLLIILKNYISVYDFEKKKTYFDIITTLNNFGAGDISLLNENPLIAICGLIPGSIRISLINLDDQPIFIQAHNHLITNINFNKDSSLIATSSETGTLIKFFDTLSGNLIGIFRRGNFNNHISSLSFSLNNLFLIAISDNGTIHLFKTDKKFLNNNDPPRAISKLNIGKLKYSDIVFINNTDFYIISSNGFLYEFSLNNNFNLELKQQYLIISH